MQRLINKCGFLLRLASHPIRTGAITESSQELAALITNNANLINVDTVVELGPGQGVFTQLIKRKIKPTTHFFALEIDPYFASKTRQRCPDVEVIEDSAANLKTHLANKGIDYCDCIISGIPWAGFSETLQLEMVNAIYGSLRPSRLENSRKAGEFLTFSYVHALYLPAGKKFRLMLEDIFSSVRKTRTVWNNVPPAFVYHCRK